MINFINFNNITSKLDKGLDQFTYHYDNTSDFVNMSTAYTLTFDL